MTFHSQKRQQGAVLIVSLMFLVILTMLGLTAMTSTTFEERMAGNSRDAALAFQAAEAAMRDARTEMIPLPNATRGQTFAISSFPVPTDLSGDCQSGVCRPRDFASKPPQKGDPLPDIPANVNWSNSSTATYGTYTGALPLGGLSQQPRYIIELFCPWMPNASFGRLNDGCRVYRFTARGFGRNPNTQVTLQELFYKESL
jgi:type IV pilus assembly protein PilX